MSSEHQLSRHIWVQFVGERVQARNVLSGRRVLLEHHEIEELDRFCQGHELDSKNTIHQKFLDADLVHPKGKPLLLTPRLELLDKRITRFLCNQLALNKRKVNEQYPDLESKLSETQSRVTESLNRNRKLDSQSVAVVSKDLDVVFDHVKSFVLKELNPKLQGFDFLPGFLPMSVGRPLPREDYEQQPCMPETSIRRIAQVEALQQPPKRCLILGDDDLLSICWSQRFEIPCDVFELDDALLEYLPQHHAKSVHLHARDLTEGLPEEFCGRYDLIYTDPMYERKGMDLFLQCCSEGLSDAPEARVLFTTRPDMIDDGHLLEQRINEAGLEIEKQVKDFSRYRLPDFYRRKLLRGFHQAGVSAQLVDGLCQIPYLYADLFWLKKI